MHARFLRCRGRSSCKQTRLTCGLVHLFLEVAKKVESSVTQSEREQLMSVHGGLPYKKATVEDIFAAKPHCEVLPGDSNCLVSGTKLGWQRGHFKATSVLQRSPTRHTATRVTTWMIGIKVAALQSQNPKLLLLREGRLTN